MSLNPNNPNGLPAGDPQLSEEKTSKGQPERLLQDNWGKHYHNHAQNETVSNWKSSRAVWAGRILFVSVLLTLAFLLGVLAFKLLTEDEATLAETQFGSISERALIQAKEGLLSRRWAGETLANFAAELYPSAEQWPFVEWLGFESVVNDMLQTSRGRDMGFVPFVRPSELAEFEEFAQDVYQSLGFPNTTAVDPNFGFGVWARNTSVTPVQKYHDTTADTPYGSPHQLLAPIFRTDEGFHPVLLFNPHSQKFTGEAIDELLTCSQERKEEYQDAIQVEKVLNTTVVTMPPHQCGVITDIFWNVKLGGRWSVANFLPIYPHNDPLQVVGYIPSIFIVAELLENVFAKEITGIDAVFETDAMSVSYKIINGEAHYSGEGKLFDEKYVDLQQTVQLADPSLYTTGNDAVPKSFVFTLTPNDDFYEVYRTQGPIAATVVVICSVVMTILVFLIYDFFVRREFHAKRELLEARRQFMRFVSHEVRTPLNAVSMGLDLMQFEVARALGYNDSTTCLQAGHEAEEAKKKKEATDQKSAEETPDLEAPESVGLEMADRPNASSSITINSVETTKSPEHSAKGQIPRVTPSKITPKGSIPADKAWEWFQLSQEIQANTQGAVDILNDLLNYDKIEQGTLQLSLHILCVWQLLEKAILEFKLPATSKQIDLRVTFGVEGPTEASSLTTPRVSGLPDNVRDLRSIGDSVRLTQVLRNLMSNALKFTPAGGSVHVQAFYIPEPAGQEQLLELDKGRVASGFENGFLRVQVTDTGAGMSPDQVAKLFQEGVQFNVNELQAGGGSGLGLYIAKGIVKQHDGTLMASSKGIGHGTTFELTIPLWMVSYGDTDCCGLIPYSWRDANNKMQDFRQSKEAKKSPAPAEEMLPTAEFTTSSTSSDSGGVQSLHVLVVDDVKSNRKLLTRLLQNKGHSCDEAENGLQAVEMVKTAAESGFPYDSILLDFEMPVMDGPTAAKEIRDYYKDDDKYAVNIVGVTGNVLPEDVSFFLSCGANDVIGKPVKMADLFASWAENGIVGR